MIFVCFRSREVGSSVKERDVVLEREQGMMEK